MPCNIDAATVWSDYVYFFKGENVWTWHYNKEELIEGPVSIDTWNVESNIDVQPFSGFSIKEYTFSNDSHTGELIHINKLKGLHPYLLVGWDF